MAERSGTFVRLPTNGAVGSMRSQTAADRGTGPNLPSRRILLIVPQPFYSDRGSPIAIREVISGYLDLGHRVDVVTFPLGQDIAAANLRFFRSGNPLRIRSVPIGFSLRKVALDVMLSFVVRERLRAASYDVVHAVEEAAFLAAYFAPRFGVPVIYDMHSRLTEGLRGLPGLGSRPMLRLGKASEQWLFRNVNVIVTSKGLAAQVRRCIPEATIFEWQFPGTLRAPSGQPDDLRAELRVPPGAPVILYSGTFSAYQGIGLLIRSVPEVVRWIPSAVFVLVGAEPDEAHAASSLAAELGVAEHVRVVPRQPRERMSAFLAVADVLVSPRSGGENLPLKIFDYLNVGKPIVATDIATHRTLLNETNALLAPPRAEAFAEAVVKVLCDQKLAERLRRGAIAYARERLGWSAFVGQLGQILDAALGGAGVGREAATA